MRLLNISDKNISAAHALPPVQCQYIYYILFGYNENILSSHFKPFH